MLSLAKLLCLPFLLEDLNLLRYLTIRVKKFDLDTEYFSNTENKKDSNFKKNANE